VEVIALAIQGSKHLRWTPSADALQPLPGTSKGDSNMGPGAFFQSYLR